MATFHISAITKEGDTYAEVVESVDRFTVYREIRQRGDTLVSIKEEGRGIGTFFEMLNNVFAGISDDEKVVLTRNLAAMLEAGLTTSRALGVMEKQTKNKKLKSVLSSLANEVKRGGTFSAGLAKFKTIFPALLISMVKAGEESGKLAQALRVVSVQMDRANRLKKKIRGALLYPSIVLIAMVGIGILMLIYVVPTLTQTFQELGTDLPATTRGVIAASNFLSSNTVLALGIGAGFIGLFLYGLKTAAGKYALDWLLLRMPVIRGLLMEINSARTTRTLASLLSAGVDVILSISITREVVQNTFYQKVLRQAEQGVAKGEPLSIPFEAHPHLYPPLVAEMIAVGEETGKLSQLLQETAEFYEESVEQQTKDLSTIIEPFLMLVIGGAVGFFAISMIAPIYSLSSAI
jgi:type IV pilus assembly protein PilC